jgi:hypothetical protein
LRETFTRPVSAERTPHLIFAQNEPPRGLRSLSFGEQAEMQMGEPIAHAGPTEPGTPRNVLLRVEALSDMKSQR